MFLDLEGAGDYRLEEVVEDCHLEEERDECRFHCYWWKEEEEDCRQEEEQKDDCLEEEREEERDECLSWVPR